MLSFWLQVCNTLKKPISAPRCLGLRATSSRVSALAQQQTIDDFLVLQNQRSQLRRPQLDTLARETFGVVTEAELCEYEDKRDLTRQLYAELIDGEAAT